MYIFSLLGIVVDYLRCEEIERNKVDNGVNIEVSGCDLILKYTLLLCEDYANDWCPIVNNGTWHTTTLNFRKNPHNKGELRSITFENSLGQNVVCEVGDDLLETLSDEIQDGLYFELCDEIIL